MELCIKHILIMFWIIVVFKVHEINYFIDKYHIWTISFFYQGLKGCKYVQCVKLTPIKYMYTYIYISLLKRIRKYNISYISGGYDRKMVVVKLIWDKKNKCLWMLNCLVKSLPCDWITSGNKQDTCCPQYEYSFLYGICDLIPFPSVSWVL